MSTDLSLEAFNATNYAIICREYSKISAGVSAYEVPVDNFDGAIFQILKLRSRFNPELAYFVTKRENLDYCLKLLETVRTSDIEIDDSFLARI